MLLLTFYDIIMYHCAILLLSPNYIDSRQFALFAVSFGLVGAIAPEPGQNIGEGDHYGLKSHDQSMSL